MDAQSNNRVYSILEIRNFIAPIAKEHGVERVYLFGSYARDEATAHSDIDLRIDSGNIQTLFELGSFYADLEEGLQKNIDIVTSDAMSGAFYGRIRNEEVMLYER